MTDREPELLDDRQQEAVICAENLLRLYSFEVGGYTPEQIVSRWLMTHSAEWVRSAIVEALYQGRYKSVSVAQILAFWQRRGTPMPHFNSEFDRMVCSKFPRTAPSRLGGMQILRQVFPNLGVSSPSEAPRPDLPAPDQTQDSRRSLRALTGDRASSFPSSASPSSASPSNSEVSSLETSSSETSSSETRSNRLTARSPGSASLLQLPNFPTARPLSESPRPGNLVPLPIRPTSETIPSSQVAAYDLRTEVGRQQFISTMIGMLSKESNLSREFMSLPAAPTHPQRLLPSAHAADFALVKDEADVDVIDVGSEHADSLTKIETDREEKVGNGQTVETGTATEATANPIAARNVEEFPPNEHRSEPIVMLQFVPRPTSSEFYATLKAMVPPVVAAATGAVNRSEISEIATDDDACKNTAMGDSP